MFHLNFKSVVGSYENGIVPYEIRWFYLRFDAPLTVIKTSSYHLWFDYSILARIVLFELQFFVGSNQNNIVSNELRSLTKTPIVSLAVIKTTSFHSCSDRFIWFPLVLLVVIKVASYLLCYDGIVWSRDVESLDFVVIPAPLLVIQISIPSKILVFPIPIPFKI